MKTIDIFAIEWFDKINGNSYFGANIILDYGMDDREDIPITFQYGYGDSYIDEAKKILTEHNYISPSHTEALWSYCKSNSIILRTYKKNGLKREAINQGET